MQLDRFPYADFAGFKALHIARFPNLASTFQGFQIMHIANFSIFVPCKIPKPCSLQGIKLLHLFKVSKFGTLLKVTYVVMASHILFYAYDLDIDVDAQREVNILLICYFIGIFFFRKLLTL